MKFPRLTLVEVVVAVTLFLGIQEEAVADFLQQRCPNAQLQCNGCQEVDQCVYDDKRGVFLAEKTVQSCPGKLVCDASADTAMCMPDAICRYKKFECQWTTWDGYYLDPYSCVEYHLCANGEQFNFLCDAQMFFNPKTKKCEVMEVPSEGCRHPPIPHCMNVGDKGVVEGTDYEYECVMETNPFRRLYPKVNLKAPYDVVSSNTQPLISMIETEKLSPCTSGVGVYPFPDDCRKFYVCWYDHDYHFYYEIVECAEGEYFDTGENKCLPGSCTTQELSPCTDGSGNYPYPGDCLKYYVCYFLPNGELTYETSKCADGEYFDAKEGECMPGSCTSSATTTGDWLLCPDGAGVYPLPNKCRTFRVCWFLPNGDLTHELIACPEGEHFDAKTGRCAPGGCTSPPPTTDS